MLKLKPLTRREEYLCWLMLFVILLPACVYFFILPAINASDAAKENLDAALLKREQIYMQNSSRNSLQTTVDKLDAEIADARSEYKIISGKEDIEKDMIDFLWQNSIYISSISIVDAPVAKDKKPSEYLNKYTVTLRAMGSMDNLMSFVDYINNVHSYRLAQIKFSLEYGEMVTSFTIDAVCLPE